MYVRPLIAVSFVGIAAFAGVLLLLSRPALLRRMTPMLAAVACGALLGDSFGHLIPESVTAGSNLSLALATIVVLAGFDAFSPVNKRATARRSVVIGANMMHDAIDGILIGTSYLVDPRLGLTSTIAITLHEIPHELGIFGVLVEKGLSPAKAAGVNALSAIAALGGTVLMLIAGGRFSGLASSTLPIVAGVFLHIALVDLLPGILNQGGRTLRFVQLVALTGAAALLIWMG